MSNPEDDLTDEEIRKMERNLLAGKPKRGTVVAVSHRKSTAPKKASTSIHIRAQRLSKLDDEEDRYYDLYIVTGGMKTLRASNHYRDEIDKMLREYRRENPHIEVKWFDPNGKELRPL
ncbi:hypothetical protein [Brucella intermedia]|uniref:hypothetical protein n=1 Tax=Brucella intermedia TaxID=94625 RepID=UPI00165D2526|nr:hypothetical protein [Brucella intermedia]QNQ40595.1 hypothetical protein IAR37_01810 [Brucella intermedia]